MNISLRSDLKQVKCYPLLFSGDAIQLYSSVVVVQSMAAPGRQAHAKADHQGREEEGFLGSYP